MHPISRKLAYLAVLALASALPTACSLVQQADDLAVAKMPVEQLQATGYLPLNNDKPGASLHVERYLVPGKYTIVEYFSPYDAPSANLASQLAQLSAARPDLAVRTVNINRPEIQGVDWQSPIAQEMQLQTLPYVQIFDPGRNLRAQARPALTQVMQWVQGKSH